MLICHLIGLMALLVSMPEEILPPDKEYLLNLLKIISFPTVAPPGSNYAEIVDWLIPLFKEMGFSTQKIVMPQEVFAARCSDKRLVGDRINMRADLDVGAKKTLVIYAHLDVVPAEGAWDSDPFLVVQKSGRVYGRGVSDCKGSIAALIAALKFLLEKAGQSTSLRSPDHGRGGGGYSGLCYLTDLGQVKGDLMLCMDGFCDDVVIGNGIMSWDVVVHGRSAHSGSSFLAVNAVERSIPIMEALMALKKVVQSRRSHLPASTALEAAGKKNLMPILNITMINGGIKENIVPDRCTLRGDRRVIPEESMDEAMAEIERALKPLDVEYDLEVPIPAIRQ